MKRRVVFKAGIYLLCVSFLLLASGFHSMVAQAREIGRPLGEMISNGDVKFESRKAVWKNVEPSQFPIFPGMKIKTEKGTSLIRLEGDRQIEVKEKSLLSFDGNDEVQITQGAINFRLPATSELIFKVGDLTVIPVNSLQASKNPLPVSPKSEATIGSISVRSNGAVTIKSLQGPLSVLNQERVVLAALSSKDTITLPSVTVQGPPKVMVAQAGEKTSDQESEEWKFLGLGTWWWVGIATGVVVIAVVVAFAASGGGGGGGVSCP